MLISLTKAISKIGLFFSLSKNKKYNKEITNYEKICTFGVNPDSLLNDTTNP
jgi:hypothetical protein